MPKHLINDILLSIDWVIMAYNQYSYGLFQHFKLHEGHILTFCFEKLDADWVSNLMKKEPKLFLGHGLIEIRYMKYFARWLLEIKRNLLYRYILGILASFYLESMLLRIWIVLIQLHIFVLQVAWESNGLIFGIIYCQSTVEKWYSLQILLS